MAEQKSKKMKSKVIFGLGAVLAMAEFLRGNRTRFQARKAKGSLACAKNYSGAREV